MNEITNIYWYICISLYLLCFTTWYLVYETAGSMVARSLAVVCYFCRLTTMCGATTSCDVHPCQRGSQVPAVSPGEISRMFESAILRHKLQPTVLSRDPWVVMFDDFLSASEAERLAIACEKGYEPARAGPRVSSHRTNNVCWCTASGCAEKVLNEAVRARVANLTNVPILNAEPTSIIRYEAQQFYAVHHDQTSHPESLPGVRVYTVLLYLLQPIQGGETHFPRLGLYVAPKRGRALVWANVLDEDPDLIDERTSHEALQTTDGAKVAANFWLHQFDLISHCAGYWDPSLPDLQRCPECLGPRATD
jgi:prolyl 4-hydroxylase